MKIKHIKINKNANKAYVPVKHKAIICKVCGMTNMYVIDKCWQCSTIFDKKIKGKK